MAPAAPRRGRHGAGRPAGRDRSRSRRRRRRRHDLRPVRERDRRQPDRPVGARPRARRARPPRAVRARSRRIERPLLDLKLFANPAFRAASIVTFCLGRRAVRRDDPDAALLPDRARQDAIQTGLLLIPQGIGGGLGMFLSGPAHRAARRRAHLADRRRDPRGGDDPVRARDRHHAVRDDRQRHVDPRHRRRPVDHAGDDGRLLGAVARAGQRRQPAADGSAAGGRIARNRDHRGRPPGSDSRALTPPQPRPPASGTPTGGSWA